MGPIVVGERSMEHAFFHNYSTTPPQNHIKPTHEDLKNDYILFKVRKISGFHVLFLFFLWPNFQNNTNSNSRRIIKSQRLLPEKEKTPQKQSHFCCSN